MGRTKGAAAPQHTETEKIALARQVCDLYESQWCTVESACKEVGIGASTFRLWAVQIVEIGEMYKNAKVKSEEHYFEERLKPKAMRSLERLIDGETYTETRNESGVGAHGPISKTVETEIMVLPNPTSVIFAMKTVFPHKTKDGLDITSGGKEIGRGPLADLPVEQQAAILRMIAKADADK